LKDYLAAKVMTSRCEDADVMLNVIDVTSVLIRRLPSSTSANVVLLQAGVKSWLDAFKNKDEMQAIRESLQVSNETSIGVDVFFIFLR